MTTSTPNTYVMPTAVPTTGDAAIGTVSMMHSKAVVAAQIQGISHV